MVNQSHLHDFLMVAGDRIEVLRSRGLFQHLSELWLVAADAQHSYTYH